MLIHIVGSTRHFDDDAPFMQIISDSIQANGDNIILNWFSAAKSRHVRQIETKLPSDLQLMVQQNEDAIAQADGIIVEGSRFNFSQGYHTALALQLGKPVLNLYRKNLMEYKEWPDKFFVVGVSNPLFTSRSYASKADLEQIITKFLDEIRPTATEVNVRFMLDNQAYANLKKVMDEDKTSEASAIKTIITKELL